MIAARLLAREVVGHRTWISMKGVFKGLVSLDHDNPDRTIAFYTAVTNNPMPIEVEWYIKQDAPLAIFGGGASGWNEPVWNEPVKGIELDCAIDIIVAVARWRWVILVEVIENDTKPKTDPEKPKRQHYILLVYDGHHTIIILNLLRPIKTCFSFQQS